MSDRVEPYRASNKQAQPYAKSAAGADGRRMPAEWESHEATWIAWPRNRADWPGKFAAIAWVYAEIVRHIAPGEKVRILVESETHEHRARRVLTATGVPLSQVEFFRCPTDRVWLRDSGPAFVTMGSSPAAVLFGFNAWAKYADCENDARVGEYIAQQLALPVRRARHNGSRVILECGSIDGNGRGTLVTTEQCLLARTMQVRNPGFVRKDYEDILRRFLGAARVLWLGDGIAGDDTNGHVDDLCRFVNAGTVVLGREKNCNDSNYRPLCDNRERLAGAHLEDGSKLDVVDLPMPAPVVFRGQRLPASYANFYIANAAVLVPTFNDPQDRVALGILSELFRDRPVVGIHAVDLVWGLGAVHCLTREQPRPEP